MYRWRLRFSSTSSCRTLSLSMCSRPIRDSSNEVLTAFQSAECRMSKDMRGDSASPKRMDSSDCGLIFFSVPWSRFSAHGESSKVSSASTSGWACPSSALVPRPNPPSCPRGSADWSFRETETRPSRACCASFFSSAQRICRPRSSTREPFPGNMLGMVSLALGGGACKPRCRVGEPQAGRVRAQARNQIEIESTQVEI